MEFHPVSGDFGYDSTFYNRAYYYAFAGYPSLFRDGKDIWSGSSPGDWRDSVNARRAKPSPVTLTITGSYNTATDSGTINASFRNDSTATISNARVYFVITEDSLYHLDGNGHAWHNHLARTFLPYTSLGDTMTLAAGQTKTKTRGFKIQSGWNENRCSIAIWYQSNTGVKDVYQSSWRKVTTLVPIEEMEPAPAPATPLARLLTNPCLGAARLRVDLAAGASYHLTIYDNMGRVVRNQIGATRQDQDIVSWDLRDERNQSVSSGVYLYRFTSGANSASGSIIVK